VHIAIVDEWLPYPVDNGKKSRSFNLLIPLARRHRITYLAPRGRNPGQDKVAEAGLRERGVTVVWVDQPVPKNSGPLFGPRLAANLLSRFPYSVQRHDNALMQQAVARLESSSQIDLWHVEWTPYVQNLRGRASASWVIDAHNIESLIWQRYWDMESNPLKAWYIRKQWQKFESFERAAFREARCVITTTECDADLAREQFGAAHVEVVSNGVDLSHFEYVDKGRDPLELLFLGSLVWRPNLEAVRQLLDTILPIIRAAEPAARLTIVGLDPPAWLRSRVASMPNVSLYGSVPDVRPYLVRCGALLAPLNIGGGSRIKILEALASGCPVISTAIGAEGLHLRQNIDYLHADAPEDFAATTINAIRNYPRLAQTAAAGNKVVRAQYGWDKLSQKLEAVWESQLAGQKVAIA
jgi:polysaccharide biosynthesis protein PslH